MDSELPAPYTPCKPTSPHTPLTPTSDIAYTLQGILSSFFFKFADTVLKKYSSTLATIFTALLSYAFFGHALTTNFFLGVSIVSVSMHQFFTFGDKSKTALVRACAAYSEELTGLLQHPHHRHPVSWCSPV